MKKCGALILTVMIMAAIVCLGGCADFAFNPIGTWHYAEHNYYLDNELPRQETPETESMMKHVSLVFGKSGTGYVDSGTKDHLGFTYDYTDKQVSVTMDAAANIANSSKNTVVYTVSEDGKTMVRSNEQSVTTKEGKQVLYREEYIYKK